MNDKKEYAIVSKYTPKQNTEFILNKHKNKYKDLKYFQKFTSRFASPLGENKKLLLKWGTGVGKTLGSIAIIIPYVEWFKSMDFYSKKKKNNRIYIIGSTSDNFIKDIKLYLSIKGSYLNADEILSYINFFGYQSFTNRVETVKKEITKESLIIIDEAHNLYNTNIVNTYGDAIYSIQDVRIIALTATPITNSVEEVNRLLKILGEEPINYDNKKEVVDAFYNKVIVVEKGQSSVNVNMEGDLKYKNLCFCTYKNSQKERKIISQFLNKELKHKANKAVDLPEKENKLPSKYSYLLNLVKQSVKKREKTIIYHNLVIKPGLNYIYEILTNNGYLEYYEKKPYSSSICFECGTIYKNHSKNHYFYPVRIGFIYSNNESFNRNKKLLEIFNNQENSYGKNMLILLGGKIIREGIDFKSVRRMIIASRPDNIPYLKQIIGRSSRTGSHDMLKKEEKYVKINILVSNNGDETDIELNEYKSKVREYEKIEVIENIIENSSVLKSYQDKDIVKENKSYQYIYKSETFKFAVSIINRLFSIYRVLTTEDIEYFIKQPPFQIEYNTKLIEKNIIKDAIHFLLQDSQLDVSLYSKFKLFKSGKYIIKNELKENAFLFDYNKFKQYQDGYNIAFLNEKENYEVLKKRMLKNTDLPFNEIIDNYTNDFHIRFVKEIIKTVRENDKKNKKLNLYKRLLIMYDSIQVILWAKDVPFQFVKDLKFKPKQYYREKNKIKYENKENYDNSINRGLNSEGLDHKKNNINETEFLNRIPNEFYLCPVGFSIMNHTELLINGSFEKIELTYEKDNRQLNDYFYGVETREPNSLKSIFKIKDISKEKEFDKRKEKQGINCNSLSREEIIKKLNLLNKENTINYRNYNIKQLCKILKIQLSYLELISRKNYAINKNPSNKRWFYFIFEKEN